MSNTIIFVMITASIMLHCDFQLRTHCWHRGWWYHVSQCSWLSTWIYRLSLSFHVLLGWHLSLRVENHRRARPRSIPKFCLYRHHSPLLTLNAPRILREIAAANWRDVCPSNIGKYPCEKHIWRNICEYQLCACWWSGANRHCGTQCWWIRTK